MSGPVTLTKKGAIGVVTVDYPPVNALGEEQQVVERHAEERLDLASGDRRALSAASDVAIPAASISRPEAIAFPTAGGATAHALYYPPANPRYRAPAGTRPTATMRSSRMARSPLHHGLPVPSTIRPFFKSRS